MIRHFHATPYGPTEEQESTTPEGLSRPGEWHYHATATGPSHPVWGCAPGHTHKVRNHGTGELWETGERMSEDPMSFVYMRNPRGTIHAVSAVAYADVMASTQDRGELITVCGKPVDNSWRATNVRIGICGSCKAGIKAREKRGWR